MSKDVKKNVKECLEMSINVIKCQKMTKMSKNFEKIKNVRKCQKMSKNIRKCQKMSKMSKKKVKKFKNVKNNVIPSFITQHLEKPVSVHMQKK